jgi:hypothetical protein
MKLFASRINPRRLFAVGLGLCVAGACSDNRGPIGHRSLETGVRVESMVAAHGLTVVLTFDPTDCLTCNGALASWLDWGRGHPGHFQLIFTRVPNRDEERRLILDHVRAAGILKSSLLSSKAYQSPREIVFVDGHEVVWSQLGKGLRTPLLRFVDSLPDTALNTVTAGAVRAVGQ